jgi:adenylate kinase
VNRAGLLPHTLPTAVEACTETQTGQEPPADVETRVLSVVAILGPPCAGKTTQARALGKRLAVPVIHSGDIVRASLAAGESRYRCCLDGHLPDPTTIATDIADTITRRLADLGACSHAIVEGFPRAAAQVDALQQALGPVEVRLSALFLRADYPLLRARSQQRHRDDDTTAVLRTRVLTEGRHYTALKTQLGRCGTFTEIDAARPPEVITNQLASRIRHEWRSPA